VEDDGLATGVAAMELAQVSNFSPLPFVVQGCSGKRLPMKAGKIRRNKTSLVLIRIGSKGSGAKQTSTIFFIWFSARSTNNAGEQGERTSPREYDPIDFDAVKSFHQCVAWNFNPHSHTRIKNPRY
jgi:hypothetical protein